jgi:tetratricopeptide (TPR) repeat protein
MRAWDNTLVVPIATRWVARDVRLGGRGLPIALAAARGLLFRAMDALELFAKGHAELVEKHYAQAIEFFDRAMEVDPGNADAWSEKGIALALLGQNEKALECHERAVEIAPQAIGGWVNKANTLHRLDRNEESAEAANSALVLNPRSPDAWYIRGRAMLDMKRYDEALDCYERVIRLDATIKRAWFNKGLALLRLKRPNEAIVAFEEAWQLGDTDARKGLSEAFCAAGKFEQALPHCEKSLELEPDSGTLWLQKGRILRELKRPAEAIPCYERSIDMSQKKSWPGTTEE